MPAKKNKPKAKSQSGRKISKDSTIEKTVIKAMSLGGVLGGGTPCAVDVKDGKIIRVRPFHYDWKFDGKNIADWEFNVRGKSFRPFKKSLPAPFMMGYKKRTYSPNRIKYPLIRVDWDPKGDRNTRNRGKSRYRRISWDEATKIVAGEIKRIRKEYGPMAILAQADGHAESKAVHAPHGCQTWLLHKMGEYTQQIRNPDSWEGWYWGAMHVWGSGMIGMMHPSDNVLKDITEHSEMVLCWGCDPETTPWGFNGQSATSICYFWRDIGIKQVYVCPDLNYGAAVHADKWIPVLPNTDAALQLAIIYTWLADGTYDKDYVSTHTVGFDRVKDYVLGEEDGIPKTPEWASEKCGVPVWTIKALASEFAERTTSVAHYFGGSYIRGPYSHEPARLECILLGMQGLGKPGVHQTQLTYSGVPRSTWPLKASITMGASFEEASNNRILRPHRSTAYAFTRQGIPKTLIQEAILNPPVHYWGTGAINATVDDQFRKYTYPLPEKEGGTEVHMIWTDTPCRTTCWNDGNKTIEALRSPKIECIVAQHPWLENDCLLADIILPSNTTFEVSDIMPNMRQGMPCTSVTLQKQAIKPIGESKSDYEVVLEVAKKLGKYDAVTEGKSSEDWIKYIYDDLLTEFISWKEFQEKEYYVFPMAKGWEKDTPGLRKFYEDPETSPLPTPSGKLEFYSENIARHFPDDHERSPIPRWVERGETHDERISSERARMFPLLLMSNHGRWRVHAQCDDIPWTREAPTCKVKGFDGYMYEPLWLNPKDAEIRCIKDRDIVKIYNERGIVLGGAYVTERLMPGVAYIDHGARCDWIIPGKVDRGGAINLIAPGGLVSKHCGGEATSGYLVEVEKLSLAQMEEWRNEYPEAFEREYDPVSGLLFGGWVEGGM
ncbi:MAG: molybdopterin-dependent oxidoreductase [Deltaproteobacteria bacterium]|nr:molybdopterin-dependent oxidoreductase [Deltaproteobacteria bacterium]